MLFDIFSLSAGVYTAGGLIRVQLRCPRCGARSEVHVRNGDWNDLACPACRFFTRQFLRAAAATVEPFTGRLGHATVAPYRFDWARIGWWGACLGPREERRVPVCFQLAGRGLNGRSFLFRWTARRLDDDREVASSAAVWEPCPCPDPACRRNRLIWWLPPTGAWDQEALACDVLVTTEDGAALFERRLELDVAPVEATGADESATEDGGAEAAAPPPSPQQTEAEVVERFHRLYYYGSPGEHQVWARTFWLNVPCLQCPLDLWVYQEILSEVRPDLVVETGTLFGGNALFLAQVLDRLGGGRVVTIDLNDLPRPAHPRVYYVTGSSTDAELVRGLLGERSGEKCLVILDSHHSREHVLAELRLFAPYVSSGSYLIVTDSNINGHPVASRCGPGPYEAVEDFLRENDEFQVDRAREKFKLTFNPMGYLKRVKSPRGEQPDRGVTP